VVLIEKTEAEDPERRRIGDEFLDDEVVVFTRLDVGAVLANGLADALVGGLVGLLECLNLGEGLASALHREFVEGIPGSRGWGRPQDFDLDVRQ